MLENSLEISYIPSYQPTLTEKLSPFNEDEDEQLSESG